MKITKREERERPQNHYPSLRDAMNRLFDESFWAPFENFSAVEPGTRGTFPRVDITENEKEIAVTADVPGINPDDIDIEVDEDALTIAGKVEREEAKEDETVYRYERSYGEFRRSFALPSPIKPDKVKAETKDGVLTITLPKAERSKRKKVKIKSR